MATAGQEQLLVPISGSMGPVRSLSVCLLLLLVTLGVESARLPADVGSLPYTVSLRRNGQHVGGAALISAKWALTAAHTVSLSGGQQRYTNILKY